jgi:hypothetical protein
MRAVLFLALSLSCVAQVANVERLRVGADSCVAALCRMLPSGPLAVRVVAHPASWLVEYALAHRFPLCGIRLTAADTVPQLELAIADVGVHYERLSGELVQRTVRWQLLAFLRLPQGQMRALEPQYFWARDTLSLALLPQVDQPAYAFATAPLPEERSLWSEILQPALALATGAVIVLLLFTLRTR